MRILPPSRGLAAFSEIEPLKCVKRRPPVSVSHDQGLYWSSKKSASRCPTVILSCASDPSLAIRLTYSLSCCPKAYTPMLMLCCLVTALSDTCAPAYSDPRCCVVLTGVSLG